MTSETLHDPPPTFTLQPSHLAQLRHIAETDEYIHDPTTPLPSSSGSSSAAATGSYDWPVLKDALKHRIRSCLEEFGEAKLDLHPATALVEWMEEGDDLEATWSKADAGLLCRESDDAEKEEPHTNGRSSTSASGGDDSAEHMYRYRLTQPSTGRMVHPPFVHRADIQNFYPTKRALPSNCTPLTPADITSHTTSLFAMLDEFDIQPPFTIQRLCELVVAPTAQYNSAVKWVGALKRCLAVTATRDAFPISPVQAPVGLVNGHTEGEGVVGMDEGEMDRLDGLPPSSRSRSASVASSVEPLFSPIPFIARDEHPLSGNDGQEEDGIPDLELGGADRTHTDGLPKEVVDVAPVPAEPSEEGDEEMPVPPTSVAAAVHVSATTAELAAPVETADPVVTPPPPPATATAAGEPLGVPQGQVDEVDNPKRAVTALTSTTTVPAEEETTEEKATEAEAEKDEEGGERSRKRRKSIASLHD